MVVSTQGHTYYALRSAGRAAGDLVVSAMHRSGQLLSTLTTDMTTPPYREMPHDAFSQPNENDLAAYDRWVSR